MQGPWGERAEARPPAEPVANTGERRFACVNCGAFLVYRPGTQRMVCPFCGTENDIPQGNDAEALRELDYQSWLGRIADEQLVEASRTLRCSACGAEFSFEADQFAGKCPFCGSATVADAGVNRHIRPAGLLPFGIDLRDAEAALDRWLGSLWFAPSDLKRTAERRDRLVGMYLPYWTFDSATTSQYRGRRGDQYTTTRWVTVTDGRGQTRQVPQTVVQVRWTPVAGTVARGFDDVLVPASRTLPIDYVQRLEPWDLQLLQAYQPEFLAGFRAEAYQVELPQGFEDAKARMAAVIRADVARAIGGDQQMIEQVVTDHAAVTFKHVLLPVWLAAYRYRAKPYRFLVNGRTGEVQGERPWSWVKITLAVLLAVVLALIVYVVTQPDVVDRLLG